LKPISQDTLNEIPPSHSDILYFFFVLAQTPSNLHWHFGSVSTGIEFDPITFGVSSTNFTFSPFTNEGCGVASDRFTGDLLFYSDGSKVIDNAHNIMPNGNSVLCSRSSIQPDKMKNPL
jgi:hypothetical protein